MTPKARVTTGTSSRRKRRSTQPFSPDSVRMRIQPNARPRMTAPSPACSRATRRERATGSRRTFTSLVASTKRGPGSRSS
ncbi:MAG TPA: hypothetical protein VGF28_14605 [Thermoanaerobaculia bacterium]